MAAPIRFGIEKKRPAMGILSSKLAEKPKAIRQYMSPSDPLAKSLRGEWGGEGGWLTSISPFPLFNKPPNLIP
jgi:hypothetical protein